MNQWANETKGSKEERVKNYFISGLSESQKGILGMKGIPHCNFQIDDEHGFVIDEGKIEQTLEYLSLEVVRERSTSYEGVVWLKTQKKEDSAESSVRARNWDGGNKDEFVEVAKEILSPVIGKKIILDVPHKHRRPIMNDGSFYIRIWSAPENYAINSQNTPSFLYNEKVDCGDDGYLPSGQGINIVDPETGWSVAEIIGDNLFIHHDLCHHGTGREVRIFRKLCEEVVASLTLSPEEKEERMRKYEEMQLERSKENYIKECSKRFLQTFTGTEEKIINGKNDIRELQKTLVRRIREIQGAERKLEQLNSYKEKEFFKYSEEYDKLLSISKIIKVDVGGGIIKVFTDTLYCVDPRTNKKHEIGKFRIEIFTENGKIRWHNLTRKVRGYNGNAMHAPHVFPEGKPCLGSMAEIIPELVANYEFAALGMVSIQFIESVNTDDDAGKYIDRWPIAE